MTHRLFTCNDRPSLTFRPILFLLPANEVWGKVIGFFTNKPKLHHRLYYVNKIQWQKCYLPVGIEPGPLLAYDSKSNTPFYTNLDICSQDWDFSTGLWCQYWHYCQFCLFVKNPNVYSCVLFCSQGICLEGSLPRGGSASSEGQHPGGLPREGSASGSCLGRGVCIQGGLPGGWADTPPPHHILWDTVNKWGGTHPTRMHFYYRPQRGCGQGYVFIRVCDSVNRGGLPQCMLGYHPTTPPAGSSHPPGSRYPPPPGANSSIRSMSGRYASYWNAFLCRI